MGAVADTHWHGGTIAFEVVERLLRKVAAPVDSIKDL
jgi:hypothetical protein